MIPPQSLESNALNPENDLDSGAAANTASSPHPQSSSLRFRGSIQRSAFFVSPEEDVEDVFEEPEEITQDFQSQLRTYSVHMEIGDGQSRDSAPERDADVDLSIAVNQCVFPEDTDLLLGNWKILRRLLLTTGTTKLTKLQYQSFRNILDAIASSGHSHWREDESKEHFSSTLWTTTNSLPHFSTIQKHFRPLVMKSLAPRIEIKMSDVDRSKAGARPSLHPYSGQPRARVPIIFPSEYAQADISTAPVWHQCLTTSLNAHCEDPDFATIPSTSSPSCVGTWPIIAARQWFYGAQQALHLEDNTPSSTRRPSPKLETQSRRYW